MWNVFLPSGSYIIKSMRGFLLLASVIEFDTISDKSQFLLGYLRNRDILFHLVEYILIADKFDEWLITTVTAYSESK